MVEVRPFKAIRPTEKLAAQVAALPYDVVDSKTARQLAQDNPYSYFHIDKAEIDLPLEQSAYDEAVYQKAASNLADFLSRGWLKKELTEQYYLYQLTMDGRTQTGLVCCNSIDDYVSGKIKKHEYTRHEKEIDRMKHICTCDANTSPIFLSYRRQEKIQSLIQNWQKQHRPIYDFTSYYQVEHKVWQINDPEMINDLQQAFAAVPSLYIADGHHRTESAVKVGLEKRAENKNSPESDYFLSILFPAEELKIWEYNRIVNVPLPADFFRQLTLNYDLSETTTKKPQQPGQVNMYLQGSWYQLTAKKIPADPVEKLDVSVLQKQVLETIFAIKDIRSDQRIDFVGGIYGPEKLEELVDQGEGTVAFSMYPTQMDDLLQVADARQIMPPKSTWFEPKLLSGLFLHDLETK